MFKTVWVARFPQGMAKADAREYWANHHGPMCKSTTIEGYVQNHVMGHLPYVSGVAQEDTHFDGYSCGWWSDEAAYDATMASEGWQALVEDGENVFDMTWLDGMSAQIEEYTIIDGPPSPYKVVWMVSFKEGMERAEGDEYWRKIHGSIFKGLPIDRYVQNHVVKSLIPGDKVGFDGFSECWFKDEAQFMEAIESEAWAEAVADGPNVFDMTQLWGARLQERVVKEVPSFVTA
jgi:uncharacterized protein (TIGR02118 family)